MKVLVCGSRLWTDVYPILRELRKLPQDTVIIHGAAKGADSLAGEVAKGLDLTVIAVPAHWKHGPTCQRGCTEYRGRGAGPIRNRKMLTMRPDLVLAFHSDIESSKGTRNMVTISRKAGVEVRVFSD